MVLILIFRLGGSFGAQIFLGSPYSDRIALACKDAATSQRNGYNALVGLLECVEGPAIDVSGQALDESGYASVTLR